MPLIDSDFYAPPWLFNGHLQTIYPALFRKVNGVHPRRFSISTRDNDFLDIDQYDSPDSRKAVIISHGLEGHSGKSYVMGMAKHFQLNGWNAFAWNYRGCSGIPNRTLRSYHSGASDDLDEVVQHAVRSGFDHITLVGFSLGGNVTLKYLGEHHQKLPEHIRSAVTFSVPLELRSGCLSLNKGYNRIYERRFLRSLKAKLRQKAKMKLGLNISALMKVRTLYQFDDLYTAPVHGFKDADDYYRRCSALYFLEQISVPTLIVNAKNDPMLTSLCFPYELLKNHPNVFFESPATGGHVGFTTSIGSQTYWSEKRAVNFVTNH